jgi:hypothetical protein
MASSGPLREALRVTLAILQADPRSARKSAKVDTVDLRRLNADRWNVIPTESTDFLFVRR